MTMRLTKTKIQWQLVEIVSTKHESLVIQQTITDYAYFVARVTYLRLLKGNPNVL